MIEKVFDNVSGIQELNQLALSLRKMGMIDSLKKLAAQYDVFGPDLDTFIQGTRCFLVDGGNTEKNYESARGKLLDEMFLLKDAQFGDVVGNYLLSCCKEPDFEKMVLLKHKTLQRCLEYLMKKALALVSEEDRKKRSTAVAVVSDSVFEWVREYYYLDDEAQIADERKKADETLIKKCADKEQIGRKIASTQKAAKKKTVSKGTGKNSTPQQDKATSETPKSGKNKAADSGKNQVDGQVSLFDAGMSSEERVAAG